MIPSSIRTGVLPPYDDGTAAVTAAPPYRPLNLRIFIERGYCPPPPPKKQVKIPNEPPPPPRVPRRKPHGRQPGAAQFQANIGVISRR